MKDLLSTFSLLLILCTGGSCQTVVYPCPALRCSNQCPFYSYGTNGCITCICADVKPSCPACTCPNGGTPATQDMVDQNGCKTCVCTPRPALSTPRPALCSLPLSSGMCLAAMPRYAYNSQTGRCEAFTYGGCGGNQNNFNSQRDCQIVCNAEVSDEPKPPKSGTCPLAQGIGLCVEACSADTDCQGDQKCCSNGCGRSCQAPAKLTEPPLPRQGTCPQPGLTPDMCAFVRFAPCGFDSECSDGMRCCNNGCGKTCMATTPPVGDCEYFNCEADQICKMTPTGPTCTLEVCPRLPGDLMRPAVCDNRCSNHSVCPGQQICCSLDACSTQCMTPGIRCPMLRCMQCPLTRPYRAYDENGCRTCVCVSAPAPCPQCICPVGSKPKRVENIAFVECPGCECEKDEPVPTVPPVTDPCQTVRCGLREICELQEVQCFVAPCPPARAVCVPYQAPPKPGDCPLPRLAGGRCLTECFSDMECSGSRKCCSNSCAMTCQEPVISDPCQNIRCRPTERCELQAQQCFRLPCPTEPVCVPDTPVGPAPPVGPPSPPPPVRQSDSCSSLECNPDEDCKMREIVCPPNSRPFECTGAPVAQCFSKFISCPAWSCVNSCSNGYLVTASGCMSTSCTCAPEERPTCDTQRCEQGKHCEMQYTETCIADAPCWKSPVCVSDGSSELNCEMLRNPGVVNNTPIVYYKPKDGCPPGSKMVRMNADGTELCCKTRAVFSDKPACENGSPQLTTSKYQCGINAASNGDGISGFFSWFVNRNKACRLGMVCTQHIEGGWSICCRAFPPPLRFRFNSGQLYY